MTRRRVAVVIAAAITLAACGADAEVVTLGATRTPPDTAPSVEVPPAATIPPTDPSTETSAPPPSPPPSTAPPSTTPPSTTPPATPEQVTGPELFVDVDLASVVDVDERKPPRAHDRFVAAALADIERWWTETYPQVYGAPFEPLAGGVYAGYPERVSDVPGCGESSTSYQDLQLYVAFYCQFGDFMAYDDGATEPSILTSLADQYGAAVMGVVLAHEYGHAIQSRIGALDRLYATILTEQQADCFAGAWTGQAYRGESPLVRLGDADVRAGLLAMLSVRDPVGTDQFVPGGHGSAFDRVGAFQEGFLAGPARCAELLEQPLDLMPNQFQTTVDAFFAGNAPYDCSELDPDVVGQELVEGCTPAPVFLAEDLDDFWRTALGEFAPVSAAAVPDVSTVSCDGATFLTPEVAVCPIERTLFYDEPAVVGLYREFGDFTLGYLYGIGWAELAQRAIGSELEGERRALLSDCFTGAWVRDITPDRNGNTPRQRDVDGDGVIDERITSSPGDLDEAIRMAILVGDPGADVDVVGSPFEKISAFRTGVLGGLDACTTLLQR